MKVLLMSHSAELWGAEQSLLDTARTLKATGRELLVVLPKKGPMTGIFEREDIPYRVMPLKYRAYRSRVLSIAGTAWNLMMSVPLALLIVRNGIDVVLTSTVVISAGAYAARFAGRPNVWFIHEFGDLDHGLKYPFGLPSAARGINRLSKFVLVTSKPLAEHFSPYMDAGRIKTVRYHIPGGEFNEHREISSPVRLVIVGRVQKGKGQEDAVCAIARLASKGIDAVLTIVGSGDDAYISILQRLADENGLQGSIRFMGYQADPGPEVRNADIVLVCSRAEAFGRVTIEGMASGRPVIGARAGATEALIDDGRTGLLYEPGNAEDLADKIEYLTSHPEMIEGMVGAARSVALRFTEPESHGNEVMHVLEEALAEEARE